MKKPEVLNPLKDDLLWFNPEGLENPTENDGATGDQVEEYIKRNIITGLSFDPDTYTLTLERAGEPLRTKVELSEPVRGLTLEFDHWIINGTAYKNIDKNVCKNDKVVAALLFKNYLLQTDDLNNEVLVNQSNPFKLKVKIGDFAEKTLKTTISSNLNNYVEIDLSEELKNINQATNPKIVFTVDAKNPVTASGIEYYSTFNNSTYTTSLSIFNPKISYDNSYAFAENANRFSFKTEYTGGKEYTIYINELKMMSESSSEPDFNFGAEASYSNNFPNFDEKNKVSFTLRIELDGISSNTLQLELLRASGDQVIYAINPTSNSITNFDLSSLYEVCIYNPTASDTKITTVVYDEFGEEGDSLYQKTKTYAVNLFSALNNYIYETTVGVFISINNLLQDKSGCLYKVYDSNKETLFSYSGLTIQSSSNYSFTSGEIYDFSLINTEITEDSYDKNPFTVSLLKELSEFGGGLKEEDDITFLRVFLNDVLEKPLSKIALVRDGFSMEFDFKISNVASYNEKVLSFGNIELYPDKLLINGIDNSDAYFNDSERTRISVTFNRGVTMRAHEYPVIEEKTNKSKSSEEIFKNSIDLIRIYVNGCIAREVKYNYTTIESTFGDKIFKVNPTSCDIDLYAVKVYGKGLSMAQVESNYISYQTDLTAKLNLVKANDIFDEDDYIVYRKAVTKYNCITYVYPKGKHHPTQFEYDKNNAIKGVSIFIDIFKKNSNGDFTEELDLDHSGVFINSLIKPLGSSAMKYYAHNTADSKGEFISDSGNSSWKKGYYMPDDKNNEIKIEKRAGKANIASSMQSHKIGATRIYEDLSPVKLEKGRHTVLLEPFLCFVWETDYEDVSTLTKADLTTSKDVRFWGFQTWGSAKKDKATWGYDAETPEFIVFEGAEDNTPLTLWHLPWIDEDILLEGETFKSIGAEGATEDGWDVDFGLATDSETELAEEVKNLTFPVWKEFFNFVYTHTTNLVLYSGTSDITLLDPATAGLDINKKYVCQRAVSGSYTAWDVFRYDYKTKKFVPAGTEKINNTYSTFNLKNFVESLGFSNNSGLESYKNCLIQDFKANVSKYIDVADWAFHQAWVRIFAGTDNRAKNTYFALRTKTSKIQAFQDDLDTILRSDNRGQFTIPYYVLEEDKYNDYSYIWNGHDNEFFLLFEEAFKDEILELVKRMIEKIESEDLMDKYFYFYLKYFPISAYNRAAHLHYEAGLIVLDSGGISGYTNNNTDPLMQSQGRALEAEQQAMDKRILMFCSLARVGKVFGINSGGISLNSLEGYSQSNKMVGLKPSLYLYPVWGTGTASNHFLNLYTRVPQNAYENPEDTYISAKLSFGATSSIKGADYIRELSNFSQIDYKNLTTRGYNLDSKSLIKFDASLQYGEKELLFLPTKFTLNTPVLRELNLSGVNSFPDLDLTNAPKLEKLLLSNTAIKTLILPESKYLKEIEIPNTIEVFESNKNPNLKVVNIPNDKFENIKSLKFDAGNKSNPQVFEKLIRASLDSPSIREIYALNIDLQLTALELEKLSEVAKQLTGKIKVVGDSISFNTKKNLVDKFGNILDKNNPKKLYVEYISESIVRSNIFVNSEISVYGENYPLTSSSDIFGLEILKGNDVSIIDGKLNITYTISSGSGATITPDGEFTVYGELENPVTVSIKVVTDNRGNPVTHTLTTKVWLKWKAPSIGDYAYADGTFSSLYDSNRTIVGLVYNTTAETSTKGIAYIIGKEYVNNTEFRIGFTNEGNISAAEGTDARNLFNVSEFLESLRLVPESYSNVGAYSSPSDLYNLVNLSNVYNAYPSIKGDTILNENLLNYSGKLDTLAYIKHVSKLLENLTDTYGEYMIQKVEDGRYYIKDLLSLNELIFSLESALTLESCVLFPYFYAAYLYEPIIENPGETLHELYTVNNWYIPSASELCHVIKARGFSADSKFLAVTSIMSGVDSSIDQNLIPFAIFSKAKKEMSINYPSIYESLFLNNLSGNYYSVVTGQGENPSGSYLNYLYGYTSTWYNNTTIYNYLWLLGTSSGSYANRSVWRPKKLKVIPYTLFNYEK